MAPIILSPVDDDANADDILRSPKETLDLASPGPSPASLTSISLNLDEGEERGEFDDVSVDGGERESSHSLSEPAPFVRKQSNLFADEDDVQGSLTATDLARAAAASPTQPQAFARGLSLMESSPPSPASLDNVDLGAQLGQTQPFDDFATSVLAQIDADEELARKLQEEENKFKWKKPTGSKPRAVRSFADSILGEPLAWEVKSTYTRVKKEGPATPRSAGAGSEDFSLSGGMSMLTNSFKSWGDSFTAAATEFFGEDMRMQKKSSSRTYRNEV